MPGHTVVAPGRTLCPPRQMQNITGKQYATITRNALSSLIGGNLVSSGSLKNTIQYEIEKSKYRQHYSSEFAKLEFSVRKNALTEIFKGLNIDSTSSDAIDTIVVKDFNQELYQKTLLVDFYTYLYHRQFYLPYLDRTMVHSIYVEQ